jgi:GT2 family glycosyltransferase
MIRKTFPWARWMQGPRRGPAANRNFGAASTSGEWLLFLDDDCVPRAGWLEAYANAAAASGEYSVLEGRTSAPGPKTRADHEAPLNPAGGLLWSCNFGIKRQLFLDLGGFDEGFPFSLEDMDLRTRLEKSGWAIKFLPGAWVEHAWRPRRGVHYCFSLTQSIGRFSAKHPETQSHFAKVWGLKRMIKIVFFEFPCNLVQHRDVSSVRVLYLDLLTAICFTLNRIRQRLTKTH